jgi:Zn-dependent protease with chaperone function
LTSPSDRSGSTARPLTVAYYDGQRSTRHRATLTVCDSMLVVTGDGFERRASLADIEIGERFGPAPLPVRFNDGAFCEVHDERALRGLMGGRLGDSAVQRWEQSWRWVAVSAIVFLCLVIVTYRYGLPAAAAAAAQRLPVSALDALSDQTLAALDGRVLQPTEVEPHRQLQVATRFERLRLPGADERMRFKVLFRKSDLLGANALALPSGTIVITDELVAVAKDDDEIAAVLAHEAGHVVRRHGARQLLQDSVVALCVTWYIGDISSLVALAPTALLQANYSRELEREADRYAADTLRLNHLSPEVLARMLVRLDESRLDESRDPSGEASKEGMRDYLSSHPVTRERLEELRR